MRITYTYICTCATILATTAVACVTNATQPSRSECGADSDCLATEQCLPHQVGDVTVFRCVATDGGVS